MMEQIFKSGFCSKTLNEESSHKIIIKSYINNYFNSEVIKGERSKGGQMEFLVNDEFKRIYILIKESVYIRNNKDVNVIDFNEAVEVAEIKVAEMKAEIKAAEIKAEIKVAENKVVNNNCYCNVWFKCGTCVIYAADHGTIQ